MYNSISDNKNIFYKMEIKINLFSSIHFFAKRNKILAKLYT